MGIIPRRPAGEAVFAAAETCFQKVHVDHVEADAPVRPTVRLKEQTVRKEG